MWCGSRSTLLGGLLFFGWLFYKKLSTKDRMLTWGIIPDATCVLYTHGSVEGHNHLFFECPYSSR